MIKKYENKDEKRRSRTYVLEYVLPRLYSVTGTSTQEGLAQALGLKQASISNAFSRGVIPDSWLMRLLERYGANPLWILYGEGVCYPDFGWDSFVEKKSDSGAPSIKKPSEEGRCVQSWKRGGEEE